MNIVLRKQKFSQGIIACFRAYFISGTIKVMSDLRYKIWFRIVIGIAASAIITLVLLLVLSGVAALIGVGKTTVKIMNIVIRLAASGVCAYIMATGRRALLGGLISSLCAFIGTSFIFFIFSGVPSFASILVNYAFTLAFCVIFSIIFVNFKKTADN